MSANSEAYRVVIRHNLVVRVGKVPDGNPDADNLSAGTRLAMNHRKNGCIDGDYDFASIHTAKDFAVLSLDFTQRLANRNRDGLEAHNFYAEETWENPLTAGGPSGQA